MVNIASGNDVVTLINVFTVSPENQQKLVDMLLEATQATMRHVPGFVSASIHKSADGTRVANYAQWRRAEDFEAMLRDPRAEVSVTIRRNHVANSNVGFVAIAGCDLSVSPCAWLFGSEPG